MPGPSWLPAALTKTVGAAGTGDVLVAMPAALHQTAIVKRS
ncbi:hypothetical protein PN499_04665 [Kamptonema animale CS-326]|nr:hypothetical protein [Kamptonema animale]MDB9510471.1 hypothetical protein [Kamptonema animale CS-326]